MIGRTFSFHTSFRLSALLGSVAALLVLLAGLPGRAAESPRVTAVRVGFDGQYKVGDWTPIWVTLSAGGEKLQGRLELTVLDGEGVEVAYLAPDAPPVEVPAKSEATFLQYVKFGRVRSHLTVRLRGDDRVRVARTFRAHEFPQPLPASHELIVTLAGDAGVSDAVRQMRRRADEQVIAAQIDDPALLPDAARGYDSIDTLVLLTSRTDFFDQLDEAQREALRQWVRLGGRLLLSVGAQGERVFGPEGVLADFAPGRFLVVAPQRRTAGLETFISAAERVGAGEGRAADLPMTILGDVRGRVEVFEAAGPAQRPMVIDYPVGFGRVTLVAIDLDREPVASWRDRGKLVRRLLEGSAGRFESTDRQTTRGRVSHIGYEDLVGQLRAALDEFPGVTLVAFSWVAALIVLYVLLIGPGDFFFLRRFVGKMERTWITFPATVLLFCLTAWAGVRYLKADRLLVNQVEIVDVDVATGLVRGASWAHVYSPQTATFDFSLSPRPAAPPAQGEAASILTWQGLPGSGLGGMNSTTGRLIDAPYQIVAHHKDKTLHVEPRGMPIPVRSSRGLGARWWLSSEPTTAAPLTATSDGAISGEIVNPLTVPVRECVLAYNHWSYRLPQELAPGARVRFSRRLPDGNLVWRLTQKYVGEDYKEFATPWDETSRDVPRIIEMMMWHEAAGGRSYTGLLHRYQGDLDLSHHLRSGRAVLVGRVADSAAPLLLDGQPLDDATARRWTWYRVIYPVTVE